MTSPATSGRHLSKFEKTTENAAFDGFGQILEARRFACSTNWWASCYYYHFIGHGDGLYSQKT